MQRRAALLICMAIIFSQLLIAVGHANNMLINPSFEEGQAEPTGWLGFGLGLRAWDSRAIVGERCLSVTGDGGYTSGWYGSRWVEPDYNHTYSVTYQVRQEAEGERGWVFGGLNVARQFTSATNDWTRHNFHFRTPDYRHNLRFEVGQMKLNGVAFFDDVALYPSIPTHRSRGRARYVLGEGERVIEWEYTSEFLPKGAYLNDRRFLYRTTAEYQHDRWVLNESEVVEFSHEVQIFGMPKVGPTLHMSPFTKAELEEKSNITTTDPDELRFIPQEGGRVEVDVAQCDGLLQVQTAMRPSGPWYTVGEIRSPGRYSFTLSPKVFPSRHIFVRLGAMHAKHIEVTRYKYTSHLIYESKEEPVYGETNYVDILFQSPTLDFTILDVGELAATGRNGARLEFTNKAGRRRLAVTMMVKQGDTIKHVNEESFNMGPDTKTLRTVNYEVKDPGPQSLMIVVRDAKKSDILLDLQCDFDAPTPSVTLGTQSASTAPSATQEKK